MQKLQFQKKSSARVLLTSFLNGLVLAVGMIALLVGGFFSTHSHFKIVGSSMQPTIAAHGYACYVQKNSAFNYGDIVVAHDESVHTAPVIKRVIALGGDLVGFYFNSSPENFEIPYFQILLVKNGQTATLLDEKYLYTGVDNATAQNQLLINNQKAYQNFISSTAIAPHLQDYAFNGQIVQVLPLADNEVFVLGDNRLVSKDSSTYGAINAASVQGKVTQIFKVNTPALSIALKHIFGF
ncbi:MAG: hypothetical protein IJ975_03095 [Clostridia bacterium]|nr:hypothetical protein [Clostridia bacterium]